jgi:acyl-coenzyme A thioesterase PaaI-like protein
LATQAGKTALADVVVEARVIKFGRTLVPLHVDPRNVDGKLVAIAQVTYMRLER